MFLFLCFFPYWNLCNTWHLFFILESSRLSYMRKVIHLMLSKKKRASGLNGTLHTVGSTGSTIQKKVKTALLSARLHHFTFSCFRNFVSKSGFVLSMRQYCCQISRTIAKRFALHYSEFTGMNGVYFFPTYIIHVKCIRSGKMKSFLLPIVLNYRVHNSQCTP